MDLKELEAIASREMTKHGLQDWSFGLAATKRRLGVCKHAKKRIEISQFHVLYNPPETVLDTLLHEIAHALAGSAAGHGPAWRAVAVRLGAIPRACDTGRGTVVVPGDWQSTCPACKKTHHFYKQPRNLAGYRCNCPAHSPLIFEFKGDPANRPAVPLMVQKAARWEAKCAGCETVHYRTRRPKAGAVYRCRCPQRCEVVWQYRRQ